jgi:hypothetical protein
VRFDQSKHHRDRNVPVDTLCICFSNTPISVLPFVEFGNLGTWEAAFNVGVFTGQSIGSRRAIGAVVSLDADFKTVLALQTRPGPVRVVDEMLVYDVHLLRASVQS